MLKQCTLFPTVRILHCSLPSLVAVFHDRLSNVYCFQQQTQAATLHCSPLGMQENEQIKATIPTLLLFFLVRIEAFVLPHATAQQRNRTASYWSRCSRF